MAFDNFTVTEVNEAVATGSSISATTLTLSPNPGYVITASNFSATITSPVNSISFVQDGVNVLMLVGFDSTVVSSNLSIPICINGAATEIMYSVSGNILGIQTGCNISNTIPTTYTGQGNFNSTNTVLSFPATADTGYYFPVQPTLILSTGSNSNYAISKTNVLDGSGNITETNFVVQYTFPSFDVTNSNLTLSACASEIYVPATVVSSYSINTGLIAEEGDTRTMTVFGNSGAVFTVAMDGVDLVTNITMGSIGSYSFPVVFPAVTTNTTYSILLSGDLVSPFAQTNPFTIQQKVNTEITLSVLFPSGLTAQSSVVKSYLPFQNPPPGDAAEVINFSWNITPTGSQVLLLANQPIASDWSNLNPVSNGGTSAFPVAAINLQNPATSGTIAVSGIVETYGGSNMETILDLTNILTVLKPIALFYGVTESGACCSPTAVNYYILENETFSNANAVLLADGTPAPDGFYKQ